MHHLVFDELALNDLKEAVSWYEGQRVHLGERLLIELRNTVRRIESNSYTYQIVKNQYRQAKVPIFPYVLIYEIIDDRVLVYRVFHTSRNPGGRFRAV